jgi:type 1 glutamine amidotransferase
VADILILSGGEGDYTDPWHAFAEISERLAGMLRDAGHRVEVSFAVAERLQELGGVNLVVVNAPSPDPPSGPAAQAAAAEGLDGFLARGGAVLALHVGVTTLLGMPSWSELIGARWVPGTSMHPPLGPSPVSATADPRTGPAREFDVYDERYTDLAVTAPLDVVVEHRHEGRLHPLIWTREVDGSRVIADALGHGPESFDSPDHRHILIRLAEWAVAGQI